MEMIDDIASYKKQPKLSKKGEPIYEWTPGKLITNLYDEEEENINEEEINEIDNEHEDIFELNEDNNDKYENYEPENESIDENLITITDEASTNDDNSNTDSDIIDSDEYNSNDEHTSISTNDENVQILVEDVNKDDEESKESNTSNYSDDSSISEEFIPSTDNENLARPQRDNAGTGVNRLEMQFDGKLYDQVKLQFTQKREALTMQRWSNRKRFRHAVQLLQRAQNDTTNSMMHERMNIALHVMFTQMTAKRGIKLFGEEAIAAMYKEYKQLNKGSKKGNPVVTPTPWEALSEDAKHKALDAVNLIKQKCCGKIKGRCAANGSKQCQYLEEDESVASPTVSLKGLLATLMIDAKEDQMVNTFDVPGAFLQAPMPEGKNVLLKMKNEFVDIMCRVNPEHLPNVWYEGKTKVLYLQVDRAIYGCIEQSALAWYNMFTGILKGMAGVRTKSI